MTQPTIRTMRRHMRESLWEHVDFKDDHPVEPHYTAQGSWTCYTCSQRIRVVFSFVARDATPKAGD